MITRKESGQAYATKPITERMGAALGLPYEFQEGVRKVAFTAIRDVSRWDWCAAALEAGVLKVDEMLLDLVGLAFTYAHETGERDETQVVYAVTKDWSREQYRIASPRWLSDGSDGQRRVQVVAPIDHHPFDGRVRGREVRWGDPEPNPAAEREWERVKAKLTRRQVEVIEAYAATNTYAAAAEQLGVDESSVGATVRRARKRAAAG